MVGCGMPLCTRWRRFCVCSPHGCPAMRVQSLRLYTAQRRVRTVRGMAVATGRPCGSSLRQSMRLAETQRMASGSGHFCSVGRPHGRWNALGTLRSFRPLSPHKSSVPLCRSVFGLLCALISCVKTLPNAHTLCCVVCVFLWLCVVFLLLLPCLSASCFLASRSVLFCSLLRLCLSLSHTLYALPPSLCVHLLLFDLLFVFLAV